MVPPSDELTGAAFHRRNREAGLIALFCRFASLDRSGRRLVLEAASLMALVWTGLRLLPLPTLRRILDRYAGPPATTRQADARSSAPVRWAIGAVAARLPQATCLVQALAADAMLRRRGFATELRIGVRVRVSHGAPLEAHAWVECGGAVVTGAIPDLPEFKVLNTAGSP
jgi:hypothetical protein